MHPFALNQELNAEEVEHVAGAFAIGFPGMITWGIGEAGTSGMYNEDGRDYTEIM